MDTSTVDDNSFEIYLDFVEIPLTNYTQNQLNDAEQKLRRIPHLIEARSSDNVIADASDDFYQVLRHNLGKSARVIDSIEAVRRKMDMIQCLRNYTDTPIFDPKNETSIMPLSEAAKEYKLIKKYFTNGATYHKDFDVDLERIFVVNRNGEMERYETQLNRQMLWHGTPLKNIINILSKGLLVDPPQYPNSSGIFGRGIYFADVVGKAAFCCRHTKKKRKGIVLLCDVSLGEIKEKKRGNKTVVLEGGFHSVQGCGRNHPDGEETVNFKQDVKIPLRIIIIRNKDRSSKDYWQPLNVYAIKNDNQVKIDYLLQINFKFKKNNEGEDIEPRTVGQFFGRAKKRQTIPKK